MTGIGIHAFPSRNSCGVPPLRAAVVIIRGMISDPNNHGRSGSRQYGFLILQIRNQLIYPLIQPSHHEVYHFCIGKGRKKSDAYPSAGRGSDLQDLGSNPQAAFLGLERNSALYLSLLILFFCPDCRYSVRVPRERRPDPRSG